MAKNSSRERTVMGGLLLADATKSTQGHCGCMPEKLDERTLAGGRRLIAHHEKVHLSRVPPTRRGRKIPLHNTPPSMQPQSGELDDDRIRVTNPRVYPFSAICAVRMKYKSSVKIIGGSGFMVGPRLLLTAGHN